MYLEPLYTIELPAGPRGPMLAYLDEAGMWLRYAGSLYPVRQTLWFGDILPPEARLYYDAGSIADDLRRDD